MSEPSASDLLRAASSPAKRTFVLIHVDFPGAGEQLRPGTTLSGKGWVIAEAEVQEIAVYLDETFLCYGFYGVPRPDVAKNFPDYPQADQSGFRFSARIGSEVAGNQNCSVVIEVLTADGAVTRRIIPMAGHSGGEGEPAVTHVANAPQSDDQPIKMFVDHAVVNKKGLLRVSGWVASLAPLRDVAVFLGDQQLNVPELGKPRPEIALENPAYPNAASSGFELAQAIGALHASRSVLRIVARCVAGTKRQVIVPIEVADPQRMHRDSDGDLLVCCESASIRSNGFAAIGGWAIASEGVRSVAISLNGQDVGEADIGISRPDVGNRFPQNSAARQSGFRFAGQIAQTLTGSQQLAVRVQTWEGKEKNLELPVEVVQSADGALKVADVFGRADDIYVEIDSPRLEGGRAAEPLTGPLIVSGWAVAPGGIDSIEVQLDDAAPAAAYVGIRREDIATKFPDDEAALFAGFAVTFPHRDVARGQHTVRVSVHTRSGMVRQRAFQLLAVTPDEAVGTLRSRLAEAEIDLRRAVLRRMGLHPVYLVAIRARDLSAGNLRRIRATLATLQGQAYSNWHATVLVSNAYRPSRAAATICAGDAELAARVSVQRCSAKTPGRGLTWPESGDPMFLLVLDAGDRLGADALLELAAAGALDRSLDFIYGDERRFEPTVEAVRAWLKPDWSPDMLLSTNYIGRAWCASRDLVERTGLTLDELAVHGEYDAVLRLTEQANAIAHVPVLLCERADSRNEPPEIERRALERAIQRRGLEAEVVPGRIAGSWRVRGVVENAGLVSIMIPTCAGGGLIETAIDTIRERTAYQHLEIVCVENIPSPEQGWKAWLRRNADQVIEVAEPFNWSRFNNLGAAVSRGDFLLFLNDDVSVTEPGWLDALLEQAQRPEIGVVGAQLLYPDGKVQHAGMFLSGRIGRHAFRYAPGDEPGEFGQALIQRNVIAVTGACMLMRRSTFETLGGFDESHSVVNNDVDFCLRSWQSGLRVVYTPFATLVHHELVSRRNIADSFDRDRFHDEWRRRIAKGDPFFHPALAADMDHYAPDPEPVEVVCTGHPLLARERVRRILALKLDHIGDFVTALPALRRLKQRFPAAELTVLAPKASLSLAALEPAIDRCMEFSFFNARSELGQRKLAERELAELREKLQSSQFDIAIDLRLHTDTRNMLRYSGAKLLAGFDHDGLFPWLDVALEWEGDVRQMAKRAHVADRIVALVDAVDNACDTDRTIVRTTASLSNARARLLALPAMRTAPAGFFDKPLVCVHPGVGNVMRQWPAESYAALIDLLVAEEGVHVLLIGGADEAPIAGEIEAMVGSGAVLSLVGRIGLADLPLVLQACALFVGNNSGPKHIAASLGVPTVGVHSGNVDAIEWGPLGPNAVAVRRKVSCGPCYLSNPADCRRELACLTGIRPAHVYRACRPLLRLGSALGVAEPGERTAAPEKRASRGLRRPAVVRSDRRPTVAQ